MIKNIAKRWNFYFLFYKWSDFFTLNAKLLIGVAFCCRHAESFESANNLIKYQGMKGYLNFKTFWLFEFSIIIIII